MTILILEDNVLWQLKLRAIVEQLGYSSIVELASVEDGATYLNSHSPDLIVADIVLQGKLSFTLFTDRPRSYPIIFISGHPEDVFFRQSLTLPNTTFLVKPFHSFSLLSAINTLLPAPEPAVQRAETTGLVVIGKYRQKVIVPFPDIAYLKAEGNYAIIHLTDRKYLLKRSLKKLIGQLDGRFVQVQKSFIINADFISRVNVSEAKVNICGEAIPIGRVYQKQLLKRLAC